MKLLIPLMFTSCASLAPDRAFVFGARTWSDLEGTTTSTPGGEPRSYQASSDEGWIAGGGFGWDIGAPSTRRPEYPLTYDMPVEIDVRPVAAPDNLPPPREMAADILNKVEGNSVLGRLIAALTVLALAASGWLGRARVRGYAEGKGWVSPKEDKTDD